MLHLEPTYLRYIYDGLVKGSIHPENAAELPEGLIGLYEEAFDERQPVYKRQQLLERFAIWALLKKEVSTQFIAEVLNQPEAEIQEFIATYSPWFNSPESGKYQLYHERLKVYLLQKLSEKEIHELHEKLILRLEQAIEAQKADEFEWYGLEFLAGHLGISSMLNGEGRKLLNLAYSQSHWQRQLKISKGYTWTKNGLSSVMSWASKHNNEEVIECGLQMVDLHYQEQNAAPQIVALVAEGDFDAALKRIESFGGADQEGVKRRFTLYMLCLLELTLLESKNKSFRKAAIEKLLNHLDVDKQVPPDTSIIKWNDFFPSYIVFQMACEWAALGLDYLIVYKRTDDWEKDWIKEKRPYTDLQFGVLLECARGISDDRQKRSALLDIAVELSKQGKVEESLAIARGISDDWDKRSALMDIAVELSKQGQVEESLSIARGISDDRQKSRAFTAIAVELSKQGQVDESASVMQESLAIARGISDVRDKSSALMDIAVALSKQGQVDESASVMQESLAIARGISDDWDKSSALMDIAVALSKQGQVEESLAIARGISDDWDKRSAFTAIAVELSKQGKVEESLSIARGISDDRQKSSALKDIAVALSKQGKVEESTSVMEESLAIARGISSYRAKSSALKDIAVALSKQGKVEESLAIARGISDDRQKSSALKDIALELSKQGKVEESASVMQESLAIARGISDNFWKSRALKAIAVELSKQGKVEESASVMEESLAIARGISYVRQKSSALMDIAVELSKQGKVEESLAIARGISVAWDKIRAIAVALSKQGQVEESLAIARGIRDDRQKSSAFTAIAVELSKQGQVEESTSVMQESLAIARGISSDLQKSSALMDIAVALSKQGQVEESTSVMEESLAIVRGISDVRQEKSRALMDIAVELSKQGKVEESASVMEESLAIARGISYVRQKSSALMDIAVELSKQANFTMAQEVGLEIPQIAVRQDAWKEISKSIVETVGWQNALRQVEIFQSDEAKQFYLKGWVVTVNVIDVDNACLKEALVKLVSDNASIEQLLQKYALRQVCMGKSLKDQTDRLNRTLNIQWAIDIKNQLLN